MTHQNLPYPLGSLKGSDSSHGGEVSNAPRKGFPPIQGWNTSSSIPTMTMDHERITPLPIPDSSPTSRPLSYASKPVRPEFSSQPLVDETTTTMEAIKSQIPTEDPATYDVPPTRSPTVQPQVTVTTDSSPIANSLSRDALLAYAYWLYDTRTDNPPGLTHTPAFEVPPSALTPEGIYQLRLLPLLLTLRSLHPRYIPILLLLSCTYHSLGDYESSLKVGYEILNIDPDYVEAMCNIGTTLRMLGKNEQAFEWWWKALRIRPTYWDTLDHLIGLLSSLAQSAGSSQRRAVLLARAMDVCQFVLDNVVDSQGWPKTALLPMELHRLQRVYFTSASLSSNDTQDAASDYFKALELVIRPPSPYSDDELYTARELILASYVLGLSLSGNPLGLLPEPVQNALHLNEHSFSAILDDPYLNIFRMVRAAGDELVTALLQEGGGALPFLLLLPDQVARLPVLLFRTSNGILPAICERRSENGTLNLKDQAALQHTNLMTTTILLTLAKRYQDLTYINVRVPQFSGTLNVNHSLSILFYYLATAFVPAASTYNNMGIVLATVASSRSHIDDAGVQQTLNGPTLAKVYYEAGLQIDSEHPHLLTNLGSLYKDQGHVEKAIQLYTKAVVGKPDFDIALANLGNAIKDTGRAWEAIEYYRRAVTINPNLPEAVCGLVNSLTAICDWRGRGGVNTEIAVDDSGNILLSRHTTGSPYPGYISRMVDLCLRQIQSAYTYNIDVIRATSDIEGWIRIIEGAYRRRLDRREHEYWVALFRPFYDSPRHVRYPINDGGFLMRLIHWLQSRLQRNWYIDVFGKTSGSNEPLGKASDSISDRYRRPELPKVLSPPVAPSVLPFNTFSYPISARLVRLIAHRHSLRISYTLLTQPWLPKHVYPPPRPPVHGKLKVAYVSNDINNHPLAHLMQSIFGLHDRTRFAIYLYTTSAWDGTKYRPKIATEVEHFVDASTWSSEDIVNDIVQKGIHIAINLGGYTKAARNDVFAARPCPVQMQLMGYAGTLGAGWCDYLICDPVACPPEMSGPEKWRKMVNLSTRQLVDDQSMGLNLCAELDPESMSEGWVYSEKFIYMPFTFMVTDHKQSFRVDESYSPEERARIPPEGLWVDEEARRAELRQVIFPDLPRDYFIFANFNQLYKIDPEIFAVWLRILVRVRRSVLWLLRFPGAGEEHILRTARQWAGEEVASRVCFTDVTKKEAHILRARVADLFLDTTECNAHTIATDVLWSGTPIVTWPRYEHKMCSRICASIANATGFGDIMVVNNLKEYEERAVSWAIGVEYLLVKDSSGQEYLKPCGDVVNLRRNLFLNRDRMPLYDTQRWVRNIEKAYIEAWRRWVAGTQFEMSDEWQNCEGIEKTSGCIRIIDEDPVETIHYDV